MIGVFGLVVFCLAGCSKKETESTPQTSNSAQKRVQQLPKGPQELPKAPAEKKLP